MRYLREGGQRGATSVLDVIASLHLCRGFAARGGGEAPQVHLHRGCVLGAAQLAGEPAAQRLHHGGGVVRERH